MTEKPTGGAAFPRIRSVDTAGDDCPVRENGEHHSAAYIETTGGMTLRDYLAAKAMAALITQDTDNTVDWDGYASMAYRVADAMLAEREK